ncbi:MAG: alpha/beta hydrolase [Alphaproteobacteria bacterium]|nr:alpha/beta hydrolase [Alphaproteobacteria bacterium]
MLVRNSKKGQNPDYFDLITKRLFFKEDLPLQSTKINDIELFFKRMGDYTKTTILWAHGWGQSHHAFLPLITSLEKYGNHLIIDFPGFGKSPPPKQDWSTADYADLMASFIKQNTDMPIIWIGHSFGCRVGLQIVSRHPELIKGMILISGAGLKLHRPWHRKILYMKARIILYKALRKLIPFGLNENKLRKKFGSADYINAGAMRKILVKTVNEDLSEIASTVTCPTTLIYGTKDTETPIEIGWRLNKLIAGSRMIPLDGLDHYSVLSGGRHQVSPVIKKFIEEIS